MALIISKVGWKLLINITCAVIFELWGEFNWKIYAFLRLALASLSHM
jgi:hypothetical protein